MHRLSKHVKENLEIEVEIQVMPYEFMLTE